ncbi:MAG: metal-dependent hydrolase [bacterium]
MPLPFGHSLMGYALYESAHQETKAISWRMILLFVLVANLPDIDFFPGFLIGHPNKFHHNLTHSLGFSLLIGGFLGAIFCHKKGKRFLPYFFLFTGLCFSHVVLDFFTADTSQPYGVPILWPLSSTYFMSPLSIFMSVQKSGTGHTFIQSLFVMHNLWVALWEIILFIPILSIIKVVKRRCRLGPTLADEKSF